MKKQRGIVLVGTATGLAGVAAYVITWLVPRSIGFADYSIFAAFWAFVFLVVAALSGIQQEVTRGTHPREPLDRRRSSLLSFASGTSLVVLAVVLFSPSTASPWCFRSPSVSRHTSSSLC